MPMISTLASSSSSAYGFGKRLASFVNVNFLVLSGGGGAGAHGGG